MWTDKTRFMLAAGCLIVGGCAFSGMDVPKDHSGRDPFSILVPMAPHDQTFTAHFGDQYVPGTFRADLDGNDITSQWSLATAGQAEWFRLDFFQQGLCVPGTFPNGPSPVTPAKICTHTLHVHGDVTVPNGWTEGEARFVPVHLVLLPKDATGRYYSVDDRIELWNNQTLTVSLNSNSATPWPQHIAVVVEALDATGSPAKFASLNGMPVEAPLFTTVGSDFTVRAVDTEIGSNSRWLLRLRARAFGAQEAEYRGVTVVKP